ncbi:Extended synaptotagmin-1 [Actinomortierella wolfii]|nr:Extended synaptotagmin-1 [Actinomortierella wolfii]KAG0226671.1 Extended synaptotagmin-1 [Actinomortierella wolfii]
MSGKLLDVTVHRAYKLEDVDKMGKNDPYVIVYTDLKDIKGSGAQTRALKNEKNPVWNETFTLENIGPNTRYLYVDIMDKEIGIDEPIGYGAIPLDQVERANGHRFDGSFGMFNHDGKPRGAIDLTLILRNRGEPQQSAHFDENKLREGVSVSDKAHKDHIKSLERKEHLGDLVQVMALAGGLYAAKKMLSGGDKPKVAKEN